MYQASKYLPKFGKNSHADIFSAERDQPYKEGKKTPLASPGVKEPQQMWTFITGVKTAIMVNI